MLDSKLNVLNIKKRNIRILHYTWFAFFMTFVMWQGLGPMMPYIKESLNLTTHQTKILLLLNVALAIPARIVVGMLVDKLGPRIMYSTILIAGGLISIAFTWSNSYEQLALIRLLCGFIGAGFVVGIRMIGEWFPARQTGLAQGIYGGWGNFGAAGASFILPAIAIAIGTSSGWRYAMSLAGVAAIAYGIAYYFLVRNTPKGSTYFKPKKSGAMEVTSVGDLFIYILMNVPLFVALGIVTWTLSPSGMALIGASTTYSIYAVLAILYALQIWKIWQINGHILKKDVPKIYRYKFKQVAILDCGYMVTFGAEIAMVLLLASFYKSLFPDMNNLVAAALTGVYASMNIIARPGGGWLSDKFGRKLILLIAFAGVSASFMILALVDNTWSVSAIVAVTIVAAIFSQAGSGAVYAMVPLVQRRMTGQIAGMVGAFGNVGGVAFLAVNSLGSFNSVFIVVAITAILVLAMILFLLEEPQGQIAETLPDGTVQMIDMK